MLYSEIPTKYPDDGDPSSSFDVAHPVWRPHLFQGWAADFIPKLVSEARTNKAYDKVLHPGGRDAIETCKELATKEGIFSGQTYTLLPCTNDFDFSSFPFARTNLNVFYVSMLLLQEQVVEVC
jgi:hypothetical protein